MMMEMEEGIMHSFYGEKYVCAKHFEDYYLQKYIKEHGHLGQCSYCGKRGKIFDMKGFMEFIENKLSQRLCSLDEADLPLVSSYCDDEDDEFIRKNSLGCYILPEKAERYESVEDLMYSYGLYTSDDNLNKDIACCFNEGIWTVRNVWEGDIDEELSYAWNYFVTMVKHKRRYTFFQDSYFVRQNEWQDDILTTINQLCRTVLISTLPKDTLIYRGRSNDTGIPRTSFEDLTAPPVGCAKENRMSAVGISMFYGALDSDTSKKEIQKGDSKVVIDLGEFVLKRKLVVIDLFKIPKCLSFWMPQYYLEYKFLEKFHLEITQPVMENPGIEYVPTQIFTEYIRFLNKKHIDGIIYRSSETKRKNIVLFYDNASSKEILRLDKTYVV